MRYYVVSDIHGCYTEMIVALKEKGYFNDKEEHKLTICGDLFDRGKEAIELQNFVMDLLSKDEVILIRGNHEDLALYLLKDWENFGFMQEHHITNGTVDTVLQLTGYDEINHQNRNNIKWAFMMTPYIRDIIPAMKDYFETKNYIFVHGWIPCHQEKLSKHNIHYSKIDEWRNLDKEQWNLARWYNGMDASNDGVIEENKTIVCGHWHCSYGHAKYEHIGSELGEDADYSPYYSKGIIAIDACTIHSHKVNCLVIEDAIE